MVRIHEVAFIIYMGCFLFYFGFLLFSHKYPKPTKFKVFNLIYKNWVDCRLKGENPITAVQALRNFIVSNSAFVSSLFILLGIMVGFYQSLLSNGNLLFGIKELTIGLVQFSLVILLIIFCLFNFILCIRYSARLSLLITGQPSEYSMGTIKGYKLTSQTFIRAQNHWTYGVRGLFYMVVGLVWIFNPFIFIVVSIFATAYLLHDHGVF